MFKVTIVEKWKSHVTASTYTFNNLEQMNAFIKLCDEDGVLIIVHNSKRSA